jgi:hypothetical protein
MLFVNWNPCQICLFEFTSVSGCIKFMKHVKGDKGYKSLGTSGLGKGIIVDRGLFLIHT